MGKGRYRIGIALLIAVLVSALAPPSARADDWSTFTQPAPPPEPPADPAQVARWQPGDPLPTGYHTERPTSGRTLTMVGGALFGSAYVPSMVLGMAGSLVCSTWGHADGGSGCGSSPGLLLIPGVGPFLYAASDHDHGANGNNSDGLLLISGAAQIGGLMLAIAGAIADSTAKPSLVRNAASTRVWLQPSVAGGSAGVLVGRTF